MIFARDYHIYLYSTHFLDNEINNLIKETHGGDDVGIWASGPLRENSKKKFQYFFPS